MSVSERLARLDRLLLGSLSPPDEATPTFAPYARLFATSAYASGFAAVVLTAITFVVTSDYLRLGIFLAVGLGVGGIAGTALAAAQREAVDAARRTRLDLARIDGASSASRLELANAVFAVLLLAIGIGGIDFGVMPHTLSAVLLGLSVQGLLQAWAVVRAEGEASGTALYPSRELSYEGRHLVLVERSPTGRPPS